MWRKFFEVKLRDTWQLSRSINCTAFRLSSTGSSLSDYQVVGLVALAKKSSDRLGQIEIFSPQKIVPSSELEIVQFRQPPVFWQPYCLAVKQLVLPTHSLINWSISIDMPLYNLTGADTMAAAIQSTSFNASTPQVNNSASKVLNANPNRKSASIYNPSTTTKVYVDVVNTVTPTAASIIIQPGSVYIADLPWVGDVYAVTASGSVTLQVREFI